MIAIANAFSLNMLSIDGERNLRVEQLTIGDVQDSLKKGEFRSIVGHSSTASLLSAMLGVNVEVNRESYALTEEDTLLVAQYSGPRLEEGVTELPEGASIVFWMVELLPAK